MLHRRQCFEIVYLFNFFAFHSGPYINGSVFKSHYNMYIYKYYPISLPKQRSFSIGSSSPTVIRQLTPHHSSSFIRNLLHIHHFLPHAKSFGYPPFLSGKKKLKKEKKLLDPYILTKSVCISIHIYHNLLAQSASFISTDFNVNN